MPMVAQNPDDPSGAPIEIVQPKSKINTVEAYPFTVGTTYIKFKISNYYVEPSFVECDWRLCKSNDPSIIISSGSKDIRKSDSSNEIKVENLQSNTKYTLRIETFEIIYDYQDETKVSLGVVVRNFSTNKTDEDIAQIQLESELAGQSSNFAYLYPDNLLTGTIVQGYGLKVTRVTAENKYYRNASYVLGCNHCNPYGSAITGFVLPNCVGYAHGRVREI